MNCLIWVNLLYYYLFSICCVIVDGLSLLDLYVIISWKFVVVLLFDHFGVSIGCRIGF